MCTKVQEDEEKRNTIHCRHWTPPSDELLTYPSMLAHPCYVMYPQLKCTCQGSMTVCYQLSTTEYWNNAPMSLHCNYASKILKHPQYISKSPL